MSSGASPALHHDVYGLKRLRLLRITHTTQQTDLLWPLMQVTATTRTTAAAASVQFGKFDERFKVSEQASAALKVNDCYLRPTPCGLTNSMPYTGIRKLAWLHWQAAPDLERRAPGDDRLRAIWAPLRQRTPAPPPPMSAPWPRASRARPWRTRGCGMLWPCSRASASPGMLDLGCMLHDE